MKPELSRTGIVPDSLDVMRIVFSCVLPVVCVGFFVLALTITACDEVDMDSVRRTLQDVHLPEVRHTLDRVFERHERAVSAAAQRLAPGFDVPQPEQRISQLRAAFRILRRPPRGIPELFSSPMSFMAAIGRDGRAICRDKEPDTMQGLDFGSRFPVVSQVLSGESFGYQLGEFESQDGSRTSVSMLFAARAYRDEGTVGAVVLGIQLSRLSKLLSQQIRLEHAAEIASGTVVWAFVYRQDEVFHFPGAPPEFFAPDANIMPSRAVREHAAAQHPEGSTGTGKMLGRPFAWAVMALPRIGDGVGTVVFRSEPM